MASSVSTVSSFELVEEQQVTEADVAMATQEAQEMRDREAAVAAGLVLAEPSTPPEGTAADVVDSLSKALKHLQFMLDRPESGKGASGPRTRVTCIWATRYPVTKPRRPRR